MNVDLSIIIVAYGIREVLEECLTALQASTDRLNKEVIYVDNGSQDDSVAMVREKFPEVIVIESPVNLGFTRANNLAYPEAKGQYVLMLNADAFVFPETLQKSYEFMEQHPDCGVMGARLVGRDGKLQPSARYFPTPWRIFLTRLGWDHPKIPFLKGIDDMQRDHHQVLECDWVPGCYLVTRKSIVDSLGFFLRHDFFMYFDDADICLRIKRQGWKVLYCPIEVIHLGGANSAKVSQVTEKGRQIAKLNTESEFIYFRQNYHLLYLLWDMLLIVAYAKLRTFKKVLTFRKTPSFQEIWQPVGSAYRILRDTHFGQRPLH